MPDYIPHDIEKKWQRRWRDIELFQADDASEKDKFYMLEMYPYPSGDLHIGHMFNYILGDVITRYKMMCGYEVLHPFGWDAFGLPAENAAIERGIKPSEWTFNNIEESKRSIDYMGLSYDWTREITTCLPDYYRWTQWIFLKLYQHGLACRDESLVNFCPGCQTVLANEQVLSDGTCYRCDAIVEKKKRTQWFFKITEYADELLTGIDDLDGWIEDVKKMQEYWIGKSEGATMEFTVEDKDVELPTFTTRPDTIYGVTFITIAPEHEVVSELLNDMPNRDEVERYIDNALRKSDIERISTIREKDGVFTGLYAINPLSAERVPIWVGDYVLTHYGTGIVMGVPAHDQRDYEFAKKYDLPIVEVIKPQDESSEEPLDQAFEDYGIMVNSGKYTDMTSQEGIKSIIKDIEREGLGKRTTTYRLRDWLISRQRYWGCPIPIIHCENCGEVPVPEKDLPVHLPPEEDVDFTPRGKSVLSTSKDYIEVECPECGGPAERDGDTMDTYVCSSWYFLRFADPNNDEDIFDEDKVNMWLPVDRYIGGKEHATSHLLYSRFFVKFFRDIGLLSFDEPFENYFSQGMIMARVKQEDGTESVEIMSKSKGNAVPVGPFVEEWGADTARIVALFAGPPEVDKEWSEEGVKGANRFLYRVWRIITENIEYLRYDHPLSLNLDELKGEDEKLYRKLHKTMKKVTEDTDDIHFNTAIASLMELLNEMNRFKDVTSDVFKSCCVGLVKMLAPYAPHISEELWEMIGADETIFLSEWIEFDQTATVDEIITIVVQVDGKLRDRMELPKGAPEEEIKETALKSERVKTHIEGKEIDKIIVVPDKIINIATK